MTRKHALIWAAIALAIPALALGWWLLSPLFTNTKVSEEFPFSANAIIPLDMARMEVERVMSDASETDQLVADYMPDSQPAVDSEGHTFTSIQALYSGTFRDVDKQHKGSGTATVYQDANGVLVLRLDEFKVTNGPELHVLLTPHDDPKSRADVFQEGYLDLGNLKGNIGSQNYAIPENTDVQSLKSVVIYCQPFHVVFSVATIKPER